MSPFMIVLIPVVVIGGIFFWLYLRMKKREEAFQAIAKRHFYTFRPQDEHALHLLEGFYLAERGKSQKASNVLRGEYEGVEFIAYDHSYRHRSSGSQNKNYTQTTLLIFESHDLDLPRFSFAPNPSFRMKGILAEKMVAFAMKMAGDRIINLSDTFPNFAEHYVARADSEAELRQLLADVDYPELFWNDKYIVEGHGGRLLIFQQGKQAVPEEMPAFLADAKRFYDVFAVDDW